ncbi:MAG TPA: hypothetical protein VJP86_08235 [Vicinamibacterales bacterium]|jgi:hypothetical protein|nr:hypothetical protein [Vicinamibacterales bacterium]
MYWIIIVDGTNGYSNNCSGNEPAHQFGWASCDLWDFAVGMSDVRYTATIYFDWDTIHEHTAITTDGIGTGQFNEPSSGQGPPGFSCPGGDSVQGDIWFSPGQVLQSANCNYTLVYGEDNNLVIYNWNDNPVWSTSTSGTAGGVWMRWDGGLFLFDGENLAWDSGSWLHDGASTFVLENDGRLAIYDVYSNLIWSNF